MAKTYSNPVAAQRKVLAAELRQLMGSACPKNVESWGTPILEAAIAKAKGQPTVQAPAAAPTPAPVVVPTPAPVQSPVVVNPSRPADTKAGPVVVPPTPSEVGMVNPERDANGTVKLFVRRNGASGLEMAPPTLEDVLGYLTGRCTATTDVYRLRVAVEAACTARLDALKAAAVPAPTPVAAATVQPVATAPIVAAPTTVATPAPVVKADPDTIKAVQNALGSNDVADLKKGCDAIFANANRGRPEAMKAELKAWLAANTTAPAVVAPAPAPAAKPTTAPVATPATTVNHERIATMSHHDVMAMGKPVVDSIALALGITPNAKLATTTKLVRAKCKKLAAPAPTAAPVEQKVAAQTNAPTAAPVATDPIVPGLFDAAGKPVTLSFVLSKTAKVQSAK